MQGRHLQFAIFIRHHDGQVGHHACGPLPRTPLFSLSARPDKKPADVQKSTFSGKRRLSCGGHDITAVRPGSDLHGTAGARQSHLGMTVIADDGGIDVAETVDLRAPRKPRPHSPAADTDEDFVHAANCARPTDQRRVANGSGKRAGCAPITPAS